MRNQTSFRLTTTLLPSDTTAKTTQVINKLDSTGAKFYPTFTEETVVITNDDRTVMETTRATCTNGVLTFVKRGLSDDNSETPVDNRKLTWNPGSLCFITAGAGDWIDKDDDITWTGDQTYTGDLVSTGSATYRGALITEKGVQYPHFDNVAALEAYASPFGGMFAVVDSTGELYRYNAVTEEWSVVESSTPTNPEMADTTTIGTVRVATDTEFNNGTATGSHGEYLVATPSQIQSVTPENELHITHVNEQSEKISTGSTSITYTIPKPGFIKLWKKDYYKADAAGDPTPCSTVSLSGTATGVEMSHTEPRTGTQTGMSRGHGDLYAVSAGELTMTITVTETLPSDTRVWIKLVEYIYFG